METTELTVRICSCRSRNPGRAKFCGNCGRPLEGIAFSHPEFLDDRPATPEPLRTVGPARPHNVAELFRKVLPLVQKMSRHLGIQSRKPGLFLLAFGLGILISIPLFGFAFRASPTTRPPTLSSGPALFQDVPLDHPLYRAWKTLLQAGAPVADRDESSRPYDPIIWEDWNRVVSHVFQRLVPELEVQQVLALHRTGPMHPQDLRSEIMELGRLLEIGKADRFVPSSQTDIPSRLEAFAAMSWLFSEAGR